MVAPLGIGRDESRPWTTSRASAARMRLVRSTADAMRATSPSAIATAHINRSACSTARPLNSPFAVIAGSDEASLLGAMGGMYLTLHRTQGGRHDQST